MSDLIDRQEAIKEIARWIGYIDEDMILRIQTGLKKMPSAESRIIRCKDCIYYEKFNENEYYCDAIYRNLNGDVEVVDFEPPQDHFCAYGVRRETDERPD